MFSKVKIDGVLVIVFGIIVVMLVISKPKMVDILYLFVMVVYMGSYRFVK